MHHKTLQTMPLHLMFGNDKKLYNHLINDWEAIRQWKKRQIGKNLIENKIVNRIRERFHS